MEAISDPEGITEYVLPVCQLEHVPELAALSEATAEKEDDQTPGPTHFYVSEATAEREEVQPPGPTCSHVSEATAEKEEHQPPGLTCSHVSEATAEREEDQPPRPTCSCVSEATAVKEEEQPPEPTCSCMSEATEKEEDQPPGPTRPHVLYIGNLNPKYSREVICSMLKDILGMASVTLQRHNIEVIRKRRQAYAFVQVATEVSLELVLKQLLVAAELEQDLVKELVKKGKNLVVGPGNTFAFGSNDSRETNSIGSSSESHLRGLQVPKRRKKPPFTETQTNSGTKSAQHAWRLTERPAAFLSGTRSDSAIVQREIVGKERLFYGAFMGNETRSVEFKRGGGEYLTGTLKHHVRKYVCAFLNSEGGSLLVGVEDNGLVLGVRCDHRDEDRVRLLIDSVLKGFKPQVFPAAYTLSFVPVIKDEDTGIFLKVIRLTVHPPKQHGEPLLYETDQGEVYIRRDGSIQGPLSGSAIQEWCRQKWTEENKKLEKKIETLLKEKEELQQHHVQQNTSPRCCALM